MVKNKVKLLPKKKVGGNDKEQNDGNNQKRKWQGQIKSEGSRGRPRSGHYHHFKN